MHAVDRVLLYLLRAHLPGDILHFFLSNYKALYSYISSELGVRRQEELTHQLCDNWELCKEYGVECSDKWYEHSPKSVEENEDVKLLWDLTIQTDREIHRRRPDIVIQKKKAKEIIIVDIYSCSRR